MGLIPDEIIAQVIDRCDVVEVIASYIPLKQNGKNFKAQCPFHNEKTPSFVVNGQKQIFHCFGCGVGGNVVTFVMKHERLEFPEAIRLLAQKVNITIPRSTTTDTPSIDIRNSIFKVNELATQYFHHLLLSDKSLDAQKARDYLKGRDFSLEIVNKFQLGFASDQWDGLILYLRSKDVNLSLMEKAGLIIARENREGFYDRFRNRVIFPIFDTRGHCRAFGARALEDGGAKYINSPETIVYTKGHYLYNFHLAKEFVLQQDSVIIVEGYVDCIMPFQAGIKNIVAALGTALTVDQIRLIHRYTKNVTMLFDMDQAGETAMVRSLDLLIEEGMNVKVATLSQGHDPDSFIRKFGVEAFNESLSKALTLFDYKMNILMNQYDPKTVEGKAKISSEMLLTIRRFENAIIRAGYLDRLCRILGVPQEALLSELNKQEQVIGKRTGNRIETKQIVVDEQHRIVERNILKLLLEEEDFILATKDEISPDDFQDAKIRGVISKIFEMFDEGKKISIVSLMNSFADKDVQQMLSKLVVNDEFSMSDKKKVYQDCLIRLKSDRSKFLRQQLMVKIREAEMTGDHMKLDELKIKFNQLVKG